MLIIFIEDSVSCIEEKVVMAVSASFVFARKPSPIYSIFTHFNFRVIVIAMSPSKVIVFLFGNGIFKKSLINLSVILGEWYGLPTLFGKEA